MREKHWVIRKITGGSIRVYGQNFVPDDQFLTYDARLDGQRFAFARYRQGDSYLPLLCLWGSEKAFYGENEPMPGPECVDGYFPWIWWRPRQR